MRDGEVSCDQVSACVRSAGSTKKAFFQYSLLRERCVSCLNGACICMVALHAHDCGVGPGESVCSFFCLFCCNLSDGKWPLVARRRAKAASHIQKWRGVWVKSGAKF